MANYPTSVPSATPATHGEVVDEIVALAKDARAHPQYIAGRWYVLPGSPASTATMGEGELDVTWWDFPIGTVLAEIWEQVVTAGTTGAVRRVGVYAHDAATGLPSGAPLYDGGTVSAETTGEKQWIISGGLTITSSHGIWIGGVTQGAAATRPVMRSVNFSQRGIHASGAGLLSSVVAGLRTAAVSGALPTFSAAPPLSGIIARQAVKIG